MTTLNHITAAEIAADFDENGLSQFSLAAGRGMPGVILKVAGDELDDRRIWITWEDGNGEHVDAFDAGEQVAVLA